MSQSPELARMRREYTYSNEDHLDIRDAAGLAEGDLAPDWSTQFAAWLADAVAFGLPEPNAMIVATASTDAVPSARTVLLKNFDDRGLVFFTNLESRKGTEALANPAASLVFPWFAMHRQVVVCGSVEPVPAAESEAYFQLRPRDSQLGAWASRQSRVLPDRSALERAYHEAEQRFPDRVPLPPHWGGLRVVPQTVEFWQGRLGRLHDRLRYRSTGDGWIVERLAP